MNQSAFSVWEDGSTQVPYKNPTVDGKPFTVCISSERWIPVNVLVFASDAASAELLVIDALQWQSGNYGKIEHHYSVTNRAQDILSKIESGELAVRVEPFDTAIISKVQWASNDGI